MENISNDIEEKANLSFELALMYVLWQTILERCNTVSEELQKPRLNLLSGCDLIRSLQEFYFIKEINLMSMKI